MLLRQFPKIDVPALYTAGNHDWHFPGVDGRDELRDAWWPALEPLHHGGAAYARYEINGIQFLLVDDSTYRIDQEQLTFVKTHLASPIPTVLLTHIPVSLPTLRDPTIERWNAPILIGDPDWEFESRDRWGTGENPSSTLEFVRTLAAAENLGRTVFAVISISHIPTQSVPMPFSMSVHLGMMPRTDWWSFSHCKSRFVTTRKMLEGWKR